MVKITVERMNQFERDFDSNKYGTQRFGQAFCNTFPDVAQCPNPTLFYQTERQLATEQIWDNYVDLESGWD